MPPTIVLIAIAILGAIALVYGYRALTAYLIFRALPSNEADGPSEIVDEATVALTGEIEVKQPVESGDAAVENADKAVGAYLWRARLPDNTNSDLTIDEWGWERQHWHTFASGIEWGHFGVNANGQTVRIDPSWLREKTDSEPLTELTLGGITNTERLSTYLWDRWYTYLRDQIEHRSFREFVGYVQRHNDDVDPDRYLLEARPLLDGTPVSVSGEVHVEEGEPILRGTSDTPFLLSDAGFDEHRRWLRQQILRKGLVAVGLLAVAGSLWFDFYVPFAVLVVAYLVYVGYHFVQDIRIFRDFLERLWN